ncbi:hypothetical protein R6Q59_005076 [Mikania micrantha]
MEKFMLCALLFAMVGFGFVTHIDGFHETSPECLESNNSTMNTIYKANLKTLLDSLAKNVPLQKGFFSTSVGNGSDQVYGLAWCRADISPNLCFECLNDTITTSLRDCPGSKVLVRWYSFCSLSFSNDSLVGKLWDISSSSSYGGVGLDDPSTFSKGFSMMQSLAGSVSNQPSMFATGFVDVGSYGKRYGLGQCSRDLSKLDCEKCLEGLLTTYHKFVLNQTRWDMRGMSCGMWYDYVRFYNDNSTISNPLASGGRERWYIGDMSLTFLSFLVFHWI